MTHASRRPPRASRVCVGFSRFALLLLAVCAAGLRADPLARIPELGFTVEAQREQDPALFTQGLLFHDGLLVESGGGYGNSRVLVRRLDDRTPLHEARAPDSWFAEGIAAIDDTLWMLTWQGGIAQTYSLPGLEPLARFHYRGDGWGLTSDGHSLIQSDGSQLLSFRDPATFALTRRLRVTADGRPLDDLNELEWVEGWVLANVWRSDWIVGIDPRDGKVGWKIPVGGLLTVREARAANVANGIAWDPSTRLLWVTGKLWPRLFALRLEIPPLPAPAPPTPP